VGGDWDQDVTVAFLNVYVKNNPLDYNLPMLTIAELPEYIRRAEKLMSAAER
jgi:hypothetical protein